MAPTCATPPFHSPAVNSCGARLWWPHLSWEMWAGDVGTKRVLGVAQAGTGVGTAPLPPQRGQVGRAAPPGLTQWAASPQCPHHSNEASWCQSKGRFINLRTEWGGPCRLPGPLIVPGWAPMPQHQGGGDASASLAGTEREGEARAPPGSGGSGFWSPLSVAPGVFLCPALENLGPLLELTGQIRPQHPLGVWAVQQQQQVLQHCGHGGVRAGSPSRRAPSLSQRCHLGWRGWWAPSAGRR